LPFKDNSFDVVFNKGVIEHFDNYIEIIKEMARIVRRNGKVIIAVPNKYNFIHPVVYYFHKNVTKTYMYGMEIMFTPKILKDGFQKAGLKNLEQDGLNPFYRLAKLVHSKNLFFRSFQFVLRVIAIVFHYIVTKPLDFLLGHKFSKYFGWEIVVLGRK